MQLMEQRFERISSCNTIVDAKIINPFHGINNNHTVIPVPNYELWGVGQFILKNALYWVFRLVHFKKEKSS